MNQCSVFLFSCRKYLHFSPLNTHWFLSLWLQFAWSREYLVFSSGFLYKGKAVSVGEFGK